ncbi:Putative phage-related protein (endonuclease) [Candidatus Phytoplasma australiense]|uniref:Putative phage-related protein (Endonuclease) n=1 Tax=Phytoplasma australiense TaxID=59748 RepID=B1V9P1_PHYAS|nr:Putative phage-related protein (endonuclease) [Candidatus Phytoplasma australiense]CAM11733.1 Putative phage-related protein (endonuclease) [Candidatus Phytoplasma australiense]
MKIELKQNTKEWYQHRTKYINASEVASITGDNPFKSQDTLIHDKIFGSPFITNEYVKHGTATEPLARNFFEKAIKKTYEPVNFVDDQDQIFSASLDGYNESTNTLLEIKCPYTSPDGSISSSWETFFITNNVPMYYWCQVQCQLYCSKAKYAYFLVYFNDQKNFVKRIMPDPNYHQKMVQAGKQYLELLEKTKQAVIDNPLIKRISLFKNF